MDVVAPGGEWNVFDNFQKHSILGRGGEGKVFHYKHKRMKLDIAIKHIEICSSSSQNSEEANEDGQNSLQVLKREVTLMCKLNPHKHIVRYLFDHINIKEQTFYIAMELMEGGSLKKMIRKKGALSMKQAKDYIRQILLGVRHLHMNKIVHRDIKSGNILLDSNGCLKLADFGISKQLRTLHTSCGATTATLGTPNYMSPEAIKGYSGNDDKENRIDGYGTKTDIWSIGCTLIEMVTAKPPWSECTPPQVIYKIGNNCTPELPANISTAATDFLKRTFVINPTHRPSAEELLGHPFADGTDNQEPQIQAFPWMDPSDLGAEALSVYPYGYQIYEDKW